MIKIWPNPTRPNPPDQIRPNWVQPILTESDWFRPSWQNLPKIKIRPNPTKSNQVPPNPTKSDQIRPNPTKSDQVPPNLTEFEEIRSSNRTPYLSRSVVLRTDTNTNFVSSTVITDLVISTALPTNCHVDQSEWFLNEFSNSVGFTCCNDVILQEVSCVGVSNSGRSYKLL